MIKAVIFDFDYTLSNRGYAIYDGFAYIVNKYFNDYDEMEKEAVIQRMVYLDEEGTISRRHIIDYLVNNYHLDNDSLSNDFATLSEIMAPKTVLDEYAIEVLEYLRHNTDYKLAILTNGDIKTQRMKLEVSGVLPYVDEAIAAIESGYKKPAREAFEYAAKKLNLKCEECLYVGDVMFNDILGAYKAHMQYLLLNNHRKRIYNPKIPTINHLNELIDYINHDQD